MYLRKMTPELAVGDIKGTIAFYEEVLGFELVLAVPARENMEWALMNCGEAEIMFHSAARRGSAGQPDFQEGVTFHYEGEGVRDLYESLKNKVQIVRHLYPTLHGTNEFSMRDPNGCVLVFAEKMRMAKEAED